MNRGGTARQDASRRRRRPLEDKTQAVTTQVRHCPCLSRLITPRYDFHTEIKFTSVHLIHPRGRPVSLISLRDFSDSPRCELQYGAVSIRPSWATRLTISRTLSLGQSRTSYHLQACDASSCWLGQFLPPSLATAGCDVHSVAD